MRAGLLQERPDFQRHIPGPCLLAERGSKTGKRRSGAGRLSLGDVRSADRAHVLPQGLDPVAPDARGHRRQGEDSILRLQRGGDGGSVSTWQRCQQLPLTPRDPWAPTCMDSGQCRETSAVSETPVLVGSGGGVGVETHSLWESPRTGLLQDHLQAKAKETLPARLAKCELVSSGPSGAGSWAPVLEYSRGTQTTKRPTLHIHWVLHCLGSHLLLLQQAAEDRMVLGPDPRYRLLLRARSARLR